MLVCVGLPADNHLEIPIFETVLGGLDLRGSIVGTRHDLEKVFELHRRGLTRVEYAERGLDEVNASIEQVLDGSAPAPRLVFRMEPRRKRVGERPRRLRHRDVVDGIVIGAWEVPATADGEPAGERRSVVRAGHG